jgi:hypothetical protein
MKIIRISDEVWQVIAEHGKFGETEDDVLRRIFKLPASPTSENVQTSKTTNMTGNRRRSFATRRMSTYIDSGVLYSEFQNGPSAHWALPDRSEKAEIRRVLDELILFAKSNDATIGQINAARKTLTSEGYYLTK